MHEHKRNTDEEDEIQNSFSPHLSLNINCLFVKSHKILKSMSKNIAPSLNEFSFFRTHVS